MDNFQKLLQQAQAGSIFAVYNLVLAYLYGSGTTPDVDQYFTWTKKAAEAGEVDALNDLCQMTDAGNFSLTDCLRQRLDSLYAWEAFTPCKRDAP